MATTWTAACLAISPEKTHQQRVKHFAIHFLLKNIERVIERETINRVSKYKFSSFI